MIGLIAGELIGSPYNEHNTDDEYFDLLAPQDVDYRARSGRNRGQMESYTIKPDITEGTVRALAVIKWLRSGGHRHGDESLNELGELTEWTAEKYSDARLSDNFRKWLGGDRMKASCSTLSACAPVALVARELPEAMELVDTVCAVTGAKKEEKDACRAVVTAINLLSTGMSKEDVEKALNDDLQFSVPAAGDPYYGSYLSHEEGEWIRHDTPTRAAKSALRAFLDSRNFEHAVRSAVVMGGESAVVAGVAAALAEAHYGGIPDKIGFRIDQYFHNDELTEVRRFDLMVGKKDEVLQKKPRNHFYCLNSHEGKMYFVDPGRSDIREALAKKFPGVPVASVANLPQALQEAREFSATVAEHSRGKGAAICYDDVPYVRTLYFYKGEIASISTSKAPEIETPLPERTSARNQFNRLRKAAIEIQAKAQLEVGFTDEERFIKFSDGYHIPMDELNVDCLVVREGDFIAGSARIDQTTGLLEFDTSAEYAIGEYNQGEWCRARVFENVPLYDSFGKRASDAAKVDRAIEGLRTFILDEGLDEAMLNRLGDSRNLDRLYTAYDSTTSPELLRYQGREKAVEYSDGIHANKHQGMSIG